jgi:DNA polymerase-3 subunit delta
MGQSTGRVSRHPEVVALVREAAAGRPKPVYLFTGESFETAAAVHALLAVLVPVAQRSFNLETYDGRTTPIATLIDSLRTPGFFPGVKAVWVRESTAFLSTEKRADVTKALFSAWNAGREQEAAEKLLTLVALAGWSDEQFQATRWSLLATSRVREVFGEELEAEQLTQLGAVHAACIARDLAVHARRDDSASLLEFLDGRMPPDAVLLFTASAVDARRRLVKRLREIGAVVDLSAARERSGALTRETVADVVQSVVEAFSKRLTAEAQELISRRAGTDLAMLTMELEKLCLYAGDQPTIGAGDVQRVFRDMAESWIFDFTGALSARHLGRALPLLRGLLEQGEPPLRLLAMIVREVRMLLVARECVDVALRGKWRADVSFNVFQSRILPHLDAASRQAFGNAHPFVVYRRLQDAARIEPGALRAALRELSNLDLRMKSSRSDPAVLLEAFVTDWCRRHNGPGSETATVRRQPSGRGERPRTLDPVVS